MPVTRRYARWVRSLVLVLAVLLAGCRSTSSGTPPPAPSAAGSDASETKDANVVTPAVADGGADGAATSLSVLFIGNSYTSENDLPRMIAELASTSGKPPAIVTEAVTIAGATFEDQTQGPARPAIAKGGFSHVVLQAQSVEPLLQPSVFRQYGKVLATDAKAIAARPVFFETWARREGDVVYAESWSGGTPQAMQDGLYAAYGDLARETGGELAKVGQAWRASLTGSPAIVLHKPDGSHPTPAGTLLAAYVLYRSLTGQPPPEASAVPAGISPADAATLRSISASVAP